MKPVNTDASAPGTSSVPACSGSSGNVRASGDAAIVARRAEQQRRHEADERLDFAVDIRRAHRAPQQAGNRQSPSPTHRGQRNDRDPPVEMRSHQERHHAEQPPPAPPPRG